MRYLLLLLALAAPAQEIDRVAASAGRDVVTVSAIRRHLRMLALVGRTPFDDSPTARRAAADRLIDQALIRREIALSRYTPPPMSEADARIEAFLQENSLTHEELELLLAAAGFSEDDLRAEVHWRTTLARFIDYRFTPGVQVSDDDIAAYFDSELLPELRRRDPNAPLPKLDDHRDAISAILLTRKTNSAVDAWLEQARASTRLRYFDDAFSPGAQK